MAVELATARRIAERVTRSPDESVRLLGIIAAPFIKIL
ncbi:hypothetical protein TVNIR_0007 [Thioalkalivibrio nitratireducens DSM 14787]|uniref:Uncharacterized protein n=1 Tax=Thioalkalivibrio nitratireducens (strain DSM 14787 / UNIQEM 213 / ALEN2) TaxID=1255043 RepID=L0DRW4_THIND|nr:hypothetical protein TVNIR_0007 [Thioalkalivibrio nitratireducens DSM 14787]